MKPSKISKLISSVQILQYKLTKKQFLFFSSIAVGALSGLAAIFLKIFVHFIFITVTSNVVARAEYFYLLLPTIGIFLTLLVVKKILKGKLVKGLPSIIHAIAKKSSIIPQEQTYAQIITSSLTVGLGGSVGLEAPIVITGAALGSNFAQIYQLSDKERTLLLACGVAAGIAAAFNAPIAGVLFTLEVLLLDVSISVFTPLIIAAATGALLSNIILKGGIILSFKLQQPFNYQNVPFYILLGLCAGCVSVYHGKMFQFVERLFGKSPHHTLRNMMIGGSCLAILIFVFPSLFGEGYESIKILSAQKPEKLLDNSFLSIYKNEEWGVLAIVGLLIFAKAIAAGLTVGGGGNGGNFAPSLFVGAYLGFFISRCINLLGITHLPESNFTLVGMAGILSGLYHAPLTAIFLIAEITGGYQLMIPLMIVSSVSYIVSKYLDPHSLDTKRLVKNKLLFPDDKDKNILTTIETAQLVEQDFVPVAVTGTLRDLVKAISISKRNIFPVIDTQRRLLGIILLDNVRNIIFKTEEYDTISVEELMTPPPDVIISHETMEVAMNKFDETGAWNLPVIANNEYIGFISKSSVFTHYRKKISNTIIE